MPLSTYYFSTHGCRFRLSCRGVAFEADALLLAAAAARALLSKKFDMLFKKELPAGRISMQRRKEVKRRGDYLVAG